MKKTILIFVITILACTGMRAQDIDTLPCGQRVKNYYYPHWIDTMEYYLHPEKYHTSEYDHRLKVRGFGDMLNVEVYQNYTDRPIKVRGLWAMVAQDREHGLFDRGGSLLDSTKLPEYLYLYVRNPAVQMDTVTWDTNRWLLPVAHARWDTNQPKMLCIKKFADGRYGNEYCYVYEAYFDSAITIQGEYWIGGTQNSNLRGHNVNPLTPYPYIPTVYLSIGWRPASGPYDHRAHTPHGIDPGDGDPEGPFHPYSNSERAAWYGPHGLITDGQHFVQLSSADTAQGEALYTAFYPDSSYQTITAVPSHGFLFSHWNDSVTDNPRTVFVTQDTAFTAYFRPAPLHSVTVRSSNDLLGYTTGDSTYYEGDPAVIKAIPLTDRYRFTHWNDSDTVNPRTIIVMQDTAFTAHFASPQGITAPDGQLSILNSQFSITPNPARSSVTVTINPQLPILNSQLSMTLTDAAGRELLNTKVSTLNFQLSLSQYPAGTYFVTLRTPDTTSTQRLVIK